MKDIYIDKCRVWFLLENKNNEIEKYIMMYLEKNTEEFDNIILNKDKCKSFMNCTHLKDIDGRHIYEKDIIEVDTKRGVVFFNKFLDSLQILFGDGRMVELDSDLSCRSIIIGNIYENPLSIIK